MSALTAEGSESRPAIISSTNVDALAVHSGESAAILHKRQDTYTPTSADELENAVELTEIKSRGDATTSLREAPSQGSQSAPNARPVQTKAQQRMAHIQFAALCWTLYLAGWNDASSGPLIPRIQSVYHVWSTQGLVQYCFRSSRLRSGLLSSRWSLYLHAL